MSKYRVSVQDLEILQDSLKELIKYKQPYSYEYVLIERMIQILENV